MTVRGADAKVQWSFPYTLSYSEKRTISVELNVVSWSDDDPKYDIRRWNKNSRTALKGIALSREEIEALFKLLKEELEQE